jgi:hypothetical protein
MEWRSIEEARARLAEPVRGAVTGKRLTYKTLIQ